MSREEQVRWWWEHGVTFAEMGRRLGVTRQRAEQLVRAPQSRARQAVHAAIKCGKLVRSDTCARCGEGGKIEAHHPDYSKPLKVEWVCLMCHRPLHPKEERARRWMDRRALRLDSEFAALTNHDP